MPMIGDPVDRTEIPDMIDPIVGVRGWQIERDGLISPSYAFGDPWKQIEHASCWRPYEQANGELVLLPHQAPSTNCSCGLYAFHSTRQLDRYYRHVPIAGIVRMWGACEVHADGFRAQHMEICALSPRRTISVNPLAVWKDPFWRSFMRVFFPSFIIVHLIISMVTLSSLSEAFLSTAQALIVLAIGMILGAGGRSLYQLRQRRAANAIYQRIADAYHVPLIPYSELDTHMTQYGQRISSS